MRTIYYRVIEHKSASREISKNGRDEHKRAAHRLTSRRPKFEKLCQFDETKQKCVADSYVLTLVGRSKILNTHTIVEITRKL